MRTGTLLSGDRQSRSAAHAAVSQEKAFTAPDPAVNMSTETPVTAVTRTGQQLTTPPAERDWQYQQQITKAT